MNQESDESKRAAETALANTHFALLLVCMSVKIPWLGPRRTHFFSPLGLAKIYTDLIIILYFFAQNCRDVEKV